MELIVFFRVLTEQEKMWDPTWNVSVTVSTPTPPVSMSFSSTNQFFPSSNGTTTISTNNTTGYLAVSNPTYTTGVGVGVGSYSVPSLFSTSKKGRDVRRSKNNILEFEFIEVCAV